VGDVGEAVRLEAAAAPTTEEGKVGLMEGEGVFGPGFALPIPIPPLLTLVVVAFAMVLAASAVVGVDAGVGLADGCFLLLLLIEGGNDCFVGEGRGGGWMRDLVALKAETGTNIDGGVEMPVTLLFGACSCFFTAAVVVVGGRLGESTFEVLGVGRATGNG